MSKDFARWTHALLRVSAGVLFLEHGLQKLFGMMGGVGSPGGSVPLASLFGIAGILELTGGVLLIVGLLTRPVAAVLVVEMVTAYFLAHLPQGGWPIQNQGELALLYASIFAFLAANGAGPLSIESAVAASTSRDRRHTIGDRRARLAA